MHGHSNPNGEKCNLDSESLDVIKRIPAPLAASVFTVSPVSLRLSEILVVRPLSNRLRSGGCEKVDVSEAGS
jgi:hypothetical protein